MVAGAGPITLYAAIHWVIKLAHPVIVNASRPHAKPVQGGSSCYAISCSAAAWCD